MDANTTAVSSNDLVSQLQEFGLIFRNGEIVAKSEETSQSQEVQIRDYEIYSPAMSHLLGMYLLAVGKAEMLKKGLN